LGERFRALESRRLSSPSVANALKLIQYDCVGFGALNFVGDSLNDGHDFRISSNCKAADLETLVFLDSRGISAAYEGSLAQLITNALDSNYLCICRPLELTMWATLHNFLAVNQLRPESIITNLGFVDFTPKKPRIADYAIRQVDYLIGANVATSVPVERYVLSNGENVPLFITEYTDTYRRSVDQSLNGMRALVLNTPPLDPNIRIERARPKSFFDMIAKSNQFNSSLSATVCDFGPFDESQTYDGVHYTAAGNELIFGQIRRYLQKAH
jgi:hypothetical protein